MRTPSEPRVAAWTRQAGGSSRRRRALACRQFCCCCRFNACLRGGGHRYCTECEERVATRVCDQCLDMFCEPCFNAAHSKGKRRQHTWTAYKDTGQASGWEEYWDEEKKTMTCVPLGRYATRADSYRLL